MTLLDRAEQYIDGMTLTLNGVAGTIRIERIGGMTEYVHVPSAAGKRTESYQAMRRKLGDDYTTRVTECEETMDIIFRRATKKLDAAG